MQNSNMKFRVYGAAVGMAVCTSFALGPMAGIGAFFFLAIFSLVLG